MLAPVLLACGLVCLSPSAALGASVAIEFGPQVDYYPLTWSELQYTADEGEANDVAVEGGPTGPLTVRDPHAVIRSSDPHCQVQNNHMATCTPEPGTNFTSVSARLGDGDDSIVIPPSVCASWIDGGPDDDDLTNGDSPQGFPCGGLAGGSGDDVLRGTGTGRTNDGRVYASGFDGGHGNDRLTVVAGGSSFTLLIGGGGDDTLIGGPFADTLIGGHDGSEFYRGGSGGVDELHGGGGDDTLGDGEGTSARGADLLDGGEGEDLINYAVRSAPVRVDLSRPLSNGESGEGDTLQSIEHALGGRGGDVLIGDESANRLYGWLGNDRLYGRGGGDLLYGGLGHDLLRGGSGDDALLSRARQCPVPPCGEPAIADGPSREHVLCGDGADKVLSDPTDLLASDCEEAGGLFNRQGDGGPPWGPFPAHPTGVSSRIVRFRIPCPAARTRSCRTFLRLSRGGERLGGDSEVIEAGKSETFAVHLSSEGQRLLRERGRMAVEVFTFTRLRRTTDPQVVERKGGWRTVVRVSSR